MKTQLKTLAILAGMIPAILLSIPAMIVGFLVSFALQMAWLCIPIVTAVVMGVVLGIVSFFKGANWQPLFSERQQEFMQWFSCWPLLGMVHLGEKFWDTTLRKLASIPGVEIVEA